MNQLQDKWIGLDEAAEYLGIKPVTLRNRSSWGGLDG